MVKVLGEEQGLLAYSKHVTCNIRIDWNMIGRCLALGFGTWFTQDWHRSQLNHWNLFWLLLDYDRFGDRCADSCCICLREGCYFGGRCVDTCCICRRIKIGNCIFIFTYINRI